MVLNKSVHLHHQVEEARLFHILNLRKKQLQHSKKKWIVPVLSLLEQLCIIVIGQKCGQRQSCKPG